MTTTTTTPRILLSITTPQAMSTHGHQVRQVHQQQQVPSTVPSPNNATKRAAPPPLPPPAPATEVEIDPLLPPRAPRPRSNRTRRSSCCPRSCAPGATPSNAPLCACATRSGSANISTRSASSNSAPMTLPRSNYGKQHLHPSSAAPTPSTSGGGAPPPSRLSSGAAARSPLSAAQCLLTASGGGARKPRSSTRSSKSP